MNRVCLGITLILAGFLNYQLYSQTSIKGIVVDSENNAPVPFANVVIYGSNLGVASNLEGKFVLSGVSPGFVKLQVSAVGFETYTSEDIMVTKARTANVSIALNKANIIMDEVVVKPSVFRKNDESPISLRVISIREIERIPGANRDISKVIQSFPGVASTPVQRNDVIVRGGGPSENSFFLDEVEIPTINHFSTQGASGGPVGILNVDFIREVNLYSGAFPANKGDALSSVLEFKQKDGNTEKQELQATLGSSEVGLTLDGPLGNKTSYILSLRRSYLQLLFSALELPFLPTYNDLQFKVKSRIDSKNELSLIGLGAIDRFALNLDANKTELQQYILNYLPEQNQESYTLGLVYKHYREHSYDTWVLSRSYLNNRSIKYQDNIENDSLKTFDYSSLEAENKLRYENTIRISSGYKINVGAGADYIQYSNETLRQDFQDQTAVAINYKSDLNFLKWSVFTQVSKRFFKNRLSVSLGIRSDANSYSEQMSNLFKQLSPRISMSYQIDPQWSLNFNTGRYYQLPAYTSLGFRDNNQLLKNKQNGISYISADHVVLGCEYLLSEQSQITVEGFYKHYRNYPFSLKDSISLANKGGDFGIFGDEEVLSIARGRSFGFELLARLRNVVGFNTVISYTLVRSEFKELDNNLQFTSNYIPSAWDNVHLLNITTTRDFSNNWQLGFKWRLVGGAPYTAIDKNKTSLIAAWEIRKQEYLNYSEFNALRSDVFHQLDIRLDKQLFFNKWSLMIYLDIQNAYNFKLKSPDIYTPRTNEQGNFMIDPKDPQRYLMKTIEDDGSGTILPSLGIIIQF